jgi:hypothetical protein
MHHQSRGASEASEPGYYNKRLRRHFVAGVFRNSSGAVSTSNFRQVG